MTEQEWLASKDPAAMLEWLGNPVGRLTWQVPSDRKLRLFACAVARAGRWSYPEEIDNGERVADGGRSRKMSLADAIGGSSDAAHLAAMSCSLSWGSAIVGRLVPLAERAALLRDIVGNPFRPATLPPGSAVACGECEGSGWDQGDCKVCGARPDEDGEINHGRGCYRLSEDGGGSEQADPCLTCHGKGTVPGPSPVLTPQVKVLAEAAYGERGPRRCEDCNGVGVVMHALSGSIGRTVDCPRCKGTGRIEDGTLDPLRLQILSDALEEAGLTSERIVAACRECRGNGYFGPAEEPAEHVICAACYGEGDVAIDRPHPVLAHLRSPGPHVRGCWALDLVLERS